MIVLQKTTTSPPTFPPGSPTAAVRRPPFSFLRNRLKQANDAAVKKLSSLRALYRLTLASGGGMGVASGSGMLGGGGGGGGDATDGGEGGATAAAADPHPHITSLATVLGEGSKLMVRLVESSLGDGVMEPVAELLHKDSKAQVGGVKNGDSFCRCCWRGCVVLVGICIGGCSRWQVAVFWVGVWQTLGRQAFVCTAGWDEAGLDGNLLTSHTFVTLLRCSHLIASSIISYHIYHDSDGPFPPTNITATTSCPSESANPRCITQSCPTPHNTTPLCRRSRF